MIPALHPPSPGIVYLAGSYAYPGIPLLEGCVGSAKRVVKALSDDLCQSHSDRLEDSEGPDWSKGQGGLMGRIWRWRNSDPWI